MIILKNSEAFLRELKTQYSRVVMALNDVPMSGVVQLNGWCVREQRKAFGNSRVSMRSRSRMGLAEFMIWTGHPESGDSCAQVGASYGFWQDIRLAEEDIDWPAVHLLGQEVIASPNTSVSSVAELAQEFCMTERTLARRLHRATGKSTLALIHSVKLRRVRILLESSRMSIEQIAEAVGYSDSTALRRLMRKVAGANPSHFRQAVGYR